MEDDKKQMDPLTVLASEQATLKAQLAEMSENMKAMMQQNVELMRTNAALASSVNASANTGHEAAKAEPTDEELRRKADELAFQACCRTLGIKPEHNKKE